MVDTFRRLDIPFMVVGGLAARSYGATRPLVDIDFYIPGGRFTDLVPVVADHVVFGPKPFTGGRWDLVFLKLEIEGQVVEVGDGFDVRVRGDTDEAWVDVSVDFDRVQHREIFGLEVPVMARSDLVAYKRLLGRDVDLRDLREMEEAAEPGRTGH